MDVAYLAAADELVGGAARWAIHLMETLGAPGAGLAVAAENLFPPLPSEAILPLAGFTASRGNISLFDAIFWTTLGSIAGAFLLYYIGALFGRSRIRLIVVKLPLLKVSDIDKSEAWFAKHGVKAVFLGRMIPIFRSLISIPAGIERMPIVTFLTFTAFGSLIWNTTFVMAGYLLGENWYIVQEYAGVLTKAILVIIILAVARFFLLRLMKARDKSMSG